MPRWVAGNAVAVLLAGAASILVLVRATDDRATIVETTDDLIFAQETMDFDTEFVSDDAGAIRLSLDIDRATTTATYSGSTACLPRS